MHTSFVMSQRALISICGLWSHRQVDVNRLSAAYVLVPFQTCGRDSKALSMAEKDKEREKKEKWQKEHSDCGWLTLWSCSTSSEVSEKRPWDLNKNTQTKKLNRLNANAKKSFLFYCHITHCVFDYFCISHSRLLSWSIYMWPIMMRRKWSLLWKLWEIQAVQRPWRSWGSSSSQIFLVGSWQLRYSFLLFRLWDSWLTEAQDK